MECPCAGLGVYVSGSADAYELATCHRHPLPPNPHECIGRDDVAALRADECLDALARVRDILWPAGQGSPTSAAEIVSALTACLSFLQPKEGDAAAPLAEPDFFARPLVRIQDVRRIDGEAALLGHVYIFGVMHHAWFVEVEDRDGDQVAVDDPFDRLDEFQQLDADAGRFQTVTVPGFAGTYVVVIYPAGD